MKRLRLLPVASAFLTLMLACSGGAADSDHHVVIGRGSADHGMGLLVAPDPLVIGQDRPAPVWWRLDGGARQAAGSFAIRFASRGPFARESASGSAESLLTLGPMRYPTDLGQHSYAIELLDAQGKTIGVGAGMIEIRQTSGPTKRAYFIAGAIGVVLLLFNYLDRKPLTRTYDH